METINLGVNGKNCRSIEPMKCVIILQMGNPPSFYILFGAMMRAGAVVQLQCSQGPSVDTSGT